MQNYANHFSSPFSVSKASASQADRDKSLVNLGPYYCAHFQLFVTDFW